MRGGKHSYCLGHTELPSRSSMTSSTGFTQQQMHYMMMAQDSDAPPAPGLAEETVTQARVALSHYLQDPENRGQELRDALDVMAAEARSKSMLPEQLLVVLKEIWYALPAVRSIDDAG